MTAPNGSRRNLVRTAAPLITLGATWATRKSMVRGYEMRTGAPAPVLGSRASSPIHQVIWASVMGATAATIEVVVWRLIERIEEPQESDLASG